MKKKLLSTLLTLCMALALLPTAFAAGATSGSCGDSVTWSYSNGVLTVQGTGPMYDYGWSEESNYDYVAPPWGDYTEEIKTAKIGNGVTRIGNCAFYECRSLTSIDIPNSVTTIGDAAFMYCGALTGVTIPDSVTTIGESAFSYCSAMTSINIPDSVTAIGYSAFDTCSSLTSVTIPSKVTSIEGFTFAWCKNLTNITIPVGVTSIGRSAFSGCSKLASVDIPDSVITIVDYAFSVCDSLSKVNYGGSKSQWDEIYIGEYNDPLTGASIIYGSAAEPGTTTPTFTDVPDWCAVEASWAADKGVALGIGNNKFDPDTTCTHIQILTFLWRAAGRQEAAPHFNLSVSDYQSAANWAYERGMINDDFVPDADCTRVDAVSYIWQVRDKQSGTASSFTDVLPDDSYADAVSWAVAAGVTVGYPDGTFRPNKTCSRAEIVAFLYRTYVQPLSK